MLIDKVNSVRTRAHLPVEDQQTLDQVIQTLEEFRDKENLEDDLDFLEKSALIAVRLLKFFLDNDISERINDLM